jgi:redox-sensing transcriptional repressor
MFLYRLKRSGGMERKEISKSVLKRLPGYLSYLKSIPEDTTPYISATALANALNMGEVQVRKDLAMVSDGGRPKVGYLRESLIEDISQFLGYDNTTDAILVGAGKLGQALLDYTGFSAYGLNILAAFDVMPSMQETLAGRHIYPMEQLEGFCRQNKVLMAIITVPASHAQTVCDRLIQCGIKAVWNFAPTHLDVPKGILVQNENMATSLAVLSMHLQAQIKDNK